MGVGDGKGVKEEGRKQKNEGFQRIQHDTGGGGSTESLTRLGSRASVTKSSCFAHNCPSSITESPRGWASAEAYVNPECWSTRTYPD